MARNIPDKLKAILDYKKDEVAALKRARPLSALESDAKAASKPRGFADALLRIAAADGNALICEVKRRSPSAGEINATRAPEGAARADETGTLIAMGRYDVDPATSFADVAFVVDDPWQGRGLGTALLARLASVAKARGLLGFTADVLSSNKAMLGVFQASGLRYESERDGGVTHVVLRFN